MWRTNINVFLTVLGTLVAYTLVANMIPQVESAVPEAVDIGPDVSPTELASLGEDLYIGAAGCTACHGLGTRAPDLLGVAGAVCRTRKPELSCKEYLFESLTDPDAYVVEGFQPIMQPMGRTLSQSQVWAMVAFLQSQGGEITVTPEDLASAAPGAVAEQGGAAVTGGGGGEATAPPDPVALIQRLVCLACHQLDGEGVLLGPPFESMADKDAEYLRRGILDPNADTAQGYEALAGTMPPNLGDQMTEPELDALIRFLKSR